MLDRTQYLGVCIRPPGVEGKPGRIRILGEVYLNDDGHWANVANYDVAVHSPSEHVFWPQHPPALEVEHGALLRVSLERTRFHGDPHKDWHSIKRRWDGVGPWDFTLFGAYVFSHLCAEWNGHQQRAAIVIEEQPAFLPAVNSTVYFRKSEAGRLHLIGPWTVTSVQDDKIRLVPRDGPWVCDYPLPQHVANVAYVRHPAGEFFLAEPNPSESTVIDLAPSEEARRWLLEQVQTVAPEVVQRLDREDSAWRRRLSAALEQHADPIKRQLAAQRWQKAAPLLDSVSAEETIASGLLECESFHQKLQEAIRFEAERHVERRAAQLTAEARKQLPSYERLEEMNQREIERLDREIREKQQLLDRLETQMADAAAHFEQSRDRLVKDFLGFQECVRLLANGQSRTTSHAGRVGLRETSAVSCGEACNGGAICTPDEFLKLRLLSAVQRWAPGASLGQVQSLHYALLGCRWCWAPHVGWARAYADALGAASQLAVISIAPTWRNYEDACSAGLSEVWTQAKERPQQIMLLALEGVDRSTTAAWAMPWLHLLAGMCDTLPCGGIGWPENLRIIATRGCDADLPSLAGTIWNAGAAVACQSDEDEASSIDFPSVNGAAGLVAAETWLQWASVEATEAPTGGESNSLGWWAHAAALDLARLERLLKAAGWSEHDAASLAHRIRLENPRQYLASSTRGWTSREAMVV